jgi:hypothetical protein
MLQRIETNPSQPLRRIVAKKASNKTREPPLERSPQSIRAAARLKSRRPLRYHHSITPSLHHSITPSLHDEAQISTSADVVPPGALAEQRSGRRQPQLPDGQRNELHCIGGLHPHQHGMLALRPCLGQRLTHIARVADRLAAYVKNDIAGLEAVFRSGACRIDIGDDNTFPPEPATSSAGAKFNPR